MKNREVEIIKKTVDVYTTELGDTWDTISLKVYGSERYISQLMNANSKHLTTVFFSSNKEIVCPDINIELSEALPPWKR